MIPGCIFAAVTYQETLDYLFTQLPMFQRSGNSALKKDLTNIRVLLAALGNPEKKLRTIHVAGTNGKGTTCHLLAAALQAHGLRVGMYTSPHYRDFRERIKINAAFIPEREVIAFVRWLQAAKLDIAPSFFEITVAMAFDYFARQAPDWVIVEVGLGGRLDSTNVITPRLSVITNIGLDHTEFLGETLPEIAGEKAGIIKPGVPVVIGETQAETTPVFRAIARQQRSQLIFADQAYRITASAEDTFAIRIPEATAAFSFETDIAGPHVHKNLLTAYTALISLAGADFTPRPRAIQYGWQHVGRETYYIGRWQVLQAHSPRCLADSAHNTEGLLPVMERLQAMEQPLHIVLGVVREKDLTAAFRYFPREAHWYFVKADIPRGLPADQLRYAAAEAGLRGQSWPSVRAGYNAARRAARQDGGLVFVGGSIFTVAEVIPSPGEAFS